jgi:hypothetical protein
VEQGSRRPRANVVPPVLASTARPLCPSGRGGRE